MKHAMIGAGCALCVLLAGCGSPAAVDGQTSSAVLGASVPAAVTEGRTITSGTQLIVQKIDELRLFKGYTFETSVEREDKETNTVVFQLASEHASASCSVSSGPYGYTVTLALDPYILDETALKEQELDAGMMEEELLPMLAFAFDIGGTQKAEAYLAPLKGKVCAQDSAYFKSLAEDGVIYTLQIRNLPEDPAGQVAGVSVKPEKQLLSECALKATESTVAAVARLSESDLTLYRVTGKLTELTTLEDGVLGAYLADGDVAIPVRYSCNYRTGEELQQTTVFYLSQQDGFFEIWACE